MDEAIAFCIEMRKQALELNNDTPVHVNYETFCKEYLMLGGMVSINGFFTEILIENEKTKIDDEFAKFNVVQTLKKTLGNRRAKITVWVPKNYTEAIIALGRYEADLNAQVEDYGQGKWFAGTVTNVLKSLMKDYEVVFELNKAEPCTLAWMKGSVYGKTYFIYQFFSLKNAPKKLLPVAKGILGLIYGSGDINSWFSDNKDININILKCITLDENLKETPDCVWALIGDIPCDKFFELLVQIAKCLELKQSNVNVDEFLHLISANPSFYSEEKNALKALFTCCVSQNDPKYNKIKEELIKKGVLPPENQ